MFIMKPTSVLLILAALTFGVTGCNPKTPRPQEGKIKRETISFTPKVTGRILKIYVSEGALVKPGDTLAMLDVPEVSAKKAQAQGVVKAASAQHLMANNGATPNQLKQLKAKFAAVTEQYAFAQKSYNRAKAMFNDSLMAPQAYDEVFAKYQAAKAQLDAVSAELNEAEKGVRFETKDATLGQQQQALGVLEEVEVAYSERYIIATNYMQVETVSLHEGELATAGYALFNGYIPSATYFRFTVPESRIAAFKVGQRLGVEVPYTRESFDGKITFIKQLARYADITAAYPDYEMEEAVYEIKVVPLEAATAEHLLVNATVILKH